jgi:hypothetical protein
LKRLVIKGKDRLWPTVIWQGTQLVVYYIDEDKDKVEIRETKGLDFDEILLHIDRGGSIFMTNKPQSGRDMDGSVKKKMSDCGSDFFEAFCDDCEA